MKVDHVRNPTRIYKLILQDILAFFNSNRRVVFAYGTDTCNYAVTYTQKWDFPNQGVYTNHGSIFIGAYDENSWQKEFVMPVHKEIMQA